MVRDVRLSVSAITDGGSEVESSSTRIRVGATVIFIYDKSASGQRLEELCPQLPRVTLQALVWHFNDDVALGERVDEKVSLAERRCVVRVNEPAPAYSVVKSVDRITGSSGFGFNPHQSPVLPSARLASMAANNAS